MSELPGHCGYALLGDNSLGFYRDPEGFISAKIEETRSKIFQTRLLNKKTVVVCSYEGARELLEDRWQDYEHGYKDFLFNVYGDNILFQNGEAASHLKECMMPIFSRTGEFDDLIRQTLDAFFEKFHSRETCLSNVYEEFKELMTRLCIELFLGYTDHGSEVSKSISDLATLHWHGIISLPLNVKIPFAGESGMRKAMVAKESLLQHIRRKISFEKNNDPPKHTSSTSVLRSMVNAPFKNAATELEQHLLLFVSALIPKAFSSIITSFVLEMAGESRRSMREKALLDSEYRKQVLLEVQRLWPPFFGGRRIAVRDTVLCGFKVPKGYAAVYASYFAQRDNSAFSDPNSFDPDRWNGCEDPVAAAATFTYGRGPRQCIGHHLIQRILIRMTKDLLEKFNWSIDGDIEKPAYKMLPVARPSDLPRVKFRQKK